MKTIILTTTLAAALSLTATGCADPCAKLTPTPQEREVVNSGGSVEREVRGVECELENVRTGFRRD